jgi:GxxExxY protein
MLRVSSTLDDVMEAVMRECVDCALAVHRALGPGYLESIYRRAMKLELTARSLRCDEERHIDVRYRGASVGAQKVDLIVHDVVVLELKAVDRLHDVHVSQLVAYLHGTGLRAGLLVNFRVPMLKQGIRRVVR